MIAALYVRVSTDDQSHMMQTTELRSYAVRMGWQVVEYAEKASSVKTRPALNQLLADARLKKFDVVVVWALDRFARSVKQLITNIELLDSCNIRFLCVSQGIDTDRRNPAATLLLHLIGAFAQFERSLIIERVRSGMTEAKRQGKHCGRAGAHLATRSRRGAARGRLQFSRDCSQTGSARGQHSPCSKKVSQKGISTPFSPCCNH